MPEYNNLESKLGELRSKMNRIFSNYSDIESHILLTDWIPPIDILENKDCITVKIDLPGINPNEIDLSISKDLLQIKGERKFETDREDENYHVIERVHGKFDRRIPLPVIVDIDLVKASYRDGVLTVNLPKLEKKSVEEIKIENLDSDK